jgi:hypothetical protein
MTYDKDCFAGSGLVDAFGYGPSLLEMKPYFNAFVNENIDFYSMDGISVPTSEDGFLRCEPKDNFAQVKNCENYWASHLASVGVAWKYEKNSAYENKIVAASGEYFTGLTDEEIKGLFEELRTKFKEWNKQCAGIFLNLSVEDNFRWGEEGEKLEYAIRKVMKIDR